MNKEIEDLVRKAKEMEARTDACPLHEWEPYITKLDPQLARTQTADGQRIGSLVCIHCGLRRAPDDPDPHRDLKEHHQSVIDYDPSGYWEYWWSK